MNEQRLIEEHIRTKGVTRCPTAISGYSSGTVSPADAAALAAHQEKMVEMWNKRYHRSNQTESMATKMAKRRAADKAAGVAPQQRVRGATTVTTSRQAKIVEFFRANKGRRIKAIEIVERFYEHCATSASWSYDLAAIRKAGHKILSPIRGPGAYYIMNDDAGSGN